MYGECGYGFLIIEESYARMYDSNLLETRFISRFERNSRWIEGSFSLTISFLDLCYDRNHFADQCINLPPHLMN